MTWDEIISLISLILFAVGLWWIFFGDDVKELLMFKKFFKKNKKEDKVMKAVNKVNESIKNDEKKEEAKKTEPVKEEWIWVDGYKGTDKDMKCRDYQYTLGELHNMPNDAEVKECESGFHLCLNLGDVFHYYRIMNGNRFFKVRALVRASDVERYGHDTEEYQDYLSNRARYSFYGMYPGHTRYDKLVARSIVFEQELTPDEILGNYVADLSEWPDDIKQYALKFGVDLARKKMQHEKLAELGYSEAFARHLIAIDKYDVAVSVGSQADLSMDMKCAIIFNK